MDAKFNLQNTHVPDKVYAYMIQSFHMLYSLISCKSGDVVSMEVFDDVGIDRDCNEIEAIQIKSVTSNNNPVSNRSVDLWKTFYNWLMGVKENEISLENSVFKLFITVNKSGEIVESFNGAKNDCKASIAWTEARNIFFEEDSIKKEIPDTYKTYVETFFDEANKSDAIKIIEKFNLETCNQSYSEFIKKEAKKLHIPNDIFPPVFQAIVGWINFEVAKCVENKRNILISYDDFEKQLSVLFRENNQRYSLISATRKPDDGQIEDELNTQKTYLKQLEIIDADYEDKIQAVNDYLTAAGDRVKWALDGKISMQQMELYEESLQRQWRYQKKHNDITSKNLEEKEAGRLLYYDCAKNKINPETCDVPDTFYNGCMHNLSDCMKVGWHPRYSEILMKEDDNNGTK